MLTCHFAREYDVSRSLPRQERRRQDLAQPGYATPSSEALASETGSPSIILMRLRGKMCWVCVCVHACTYVFICGGICLCVCVCLYACVCVYLCLHLCTRKFPAQRNVISYNNIFSSPYGSCRLPLKPVPFLPLSTVEHINLSHSLLLSDNQYRWNHMDFNRHRCVYMHIHFCVPCVYKYVCACCVCERMDFRKAPPHSDC